MSASGGEDEQETHLVAAAAAEAATTTLARAEAALPVAATGGSIAKAPGGPVAPVAPARPEQDTAACRAQLPSHERSTLSLACTGFRGHESPPVYLSRLSSSDIAILRST